MTIPPVRRFRGGLPLRVVVVSVFKIPPLLGNATSADEWRFSRLYLQVPRFKVHSANVFVNDRGKFAVLDTIKKSRCETYKTASSPAIMRVIPAMLTMPPSLRRSRLAGVA